MRARTLDELSRFLRDDLAWRRKENSVLRAAAIRSEAGKKQALLRGAVAVLYAHWEGFVKTAYTVYLDYVRMRKLRNCDLRHELLSLALKLRLKSCDVERSDSHAEFGAWLLREWTQRARLPDPKDVFGTSNLNSAVFKGFVKALGLSYEHDFATAEKSVIDTLVEFRNHLAHGEWLLVDESEYEQLFAWTDKLMVLVCDQVEDAVAKSGYRRFGPPVVIADP
jgi:hypothetical protein